MPKKRFTDEELYERKREQNRLSRQKMQRHKYVNAGGDVKLREIVDHGATQQETPADHPGSWRGHSSNLGEGCCWKSARRYHD